MTLGLKGLNEISILPYHYGNDVSNIRQLVENRLKKEKVFVKDIRSREIGRNEQYIGCKLSYFIDKKEVAGGINYFIECASTDRKACFGFLRLRITEDSYFQELKNKGLITRIACIQSCQRI